MAEAPGVVSPMNGVEEEEQQQAAIEPYITPEYYNSLRHFQVNKPNFQISWFGCKSHTHHV